jgi:glycosyltransferase involved in cell wall biosynthesis
MLTEAARPHLGDGNPAANGRVVIPCCADLDRIAECAGERTATREELGVTERFVMVYVGKFGGWYMHEAMVNYYKVAQQRDPELFFLIVTQDDATPVLRELERRGVGPQDYRILSADPHDLGRYLAASDFGISLIRPCFSKIASSPTKIGEYLGAGLPVLSTAGIGDIDRLLLGNRVGVLVRDFSEAGFVAAAAEIRDLCAAPDIRRRCSDVARRELALREVGIPRYDKLYRDVAAGL